MLSRHKRSNIITPFASPSNETAYITTSINNSCEDALQTEIKKFTTWLSKNQRHPAHEYAKNVYPYVINGDASLDDIIATNDALYNTNENTLDKLHHRAEHAFGAGNPRYIGFGVGLLLLGISLTILSMLLLMAIIPCAIPLIGTVTLILGAAIITCSTSFFKASRPEGIAKALNILHHEIKEGVKCHFTTC